MFRQQNDVVSNDLDVIREEDLCVIRDEAVSSGVSGAPSKLNDTTTVATNCRCAQSYSEVSLKTVDNKIDPIEVERLLREKEAQLTADFEERLEREITLLKERCDYILLNEQIRTSHMLREAHRERQEKITALQTQLECKNMAGLMYVMCKERQRSKLDKLRLVEEYSNYIFALHDILSEAQSLILNLSRGYKTATRVDYEWREKMKKILKEFQMFIYDFAGGPPDQHQFYLNEPNILKTEHPVVDNPDEDPCECYDDNLSEFDRGIIEEKKPWWERLESDARPFVVYGDMAEFKPPERRAVRKAMKAPKTAPRKWKEYVFNQMSLQSDCTNADVIKDEYPLRVPTSKWECHGSPQNDVSKLSISPSHRATAASVDVRGVMGSILKMITASAIQYTETKATLLGARDSMEIASATKVREKRKHSEHGRVVINVGNRRATLMEEEYENTDYSRNISREEQRNIELVQEEEERYEEDDVDAQSTQGLGSIHNDSLHVIGQHVPERDHVINYEKVCPMEKCELLKVDSFMRSLPAYMRANPFTHFEQSYEEYETCSPEQLEVLKQRLESKKKRDQPDLEKDPLEEWTLVGGVGVQTSEIDMTLPPCTCRVPSPSPVSSFGRIFNMSDLIPVKQAIDRIQRDCFYDNNIQFDRFQVVGQESEDSMKRTPKWETGQNVHKRLDQIKKTLNQHPSLLDIFQGNTIC